MKITCTTRNYLTATAAAFAFMPAMTFVAPSASAAPDRCSTPSGASTTAVIGCSCNWGSDPTLTAGGAVAYCRHISNYPEVPVGFWTYTDVDIYVPPQAYDFNMFVCQSQTNRSADECAVYLTQPSYYGNGVAEY